MGMGIATLVVYTHNEQWWVQQCPFFYLRASHCENVESKGMGGDSEKVSVYFTGSMQGFYTLRTMEQINYVGQ
jgi:hypothetical protein